MLRGHPEIEIVAECANGFEAVKAIGETRPDLLFLDVQMPKLDGFEVLELIDPGPVVIFVTAYDQYAMRAFDAHAVDYLLKPFSAGALRKRAGARHVAAGRAPPAARTWRPRRAPPEQRPQRIVVKDGPRVHVIPIDKLDYVEAQDDYVALHSGGKSYLKQQPIAVAGSRCSTRRASCAFTAPPSSTWSAWRASSRTARRAASRFWPTARACR